VDPAAIAYHAPQRPQMLQGAADHAWHGSDRFQHDRPMAVSTGEECVGEEPQKPGEPLRNVIGEIPGRAV